MTDKNYLSIEFLCTIMILLCVTNVFVVSQKSSSVGNDAPSPEERNNLEPTLKILYWWVKVKCH